MLSVYFMGGLGNQLFQLFTLIALSIEYHQPYVLPYEEVLTTGIHRPTYWSTFLNRFAKDTTANPERRITNADISRYAIYQERGFPYVKIQLQNQDANIILYGYFQSYRYFDNYRNTLFTRLGIQEYQAQFRERFAHILADATTMSMHFRLGDYKEKQQFHPILHEAYYREALARILDKRSNATLVRILYFCEKEDNDIVSATIKRLKDTAHRTVEFIKVDDELADWEQLILMSCCRDNIIANSSFSWWAAYFNRDNEKMVCYPKTWFGPANPASTSDLFPRDWIKIEE